jgi:hypothetical protein
MTAAGFPSLDLWSTACPETTLTTNTIVSPCFGVHQASKHTYAHAHSPKRQGENTPENKTNSEQKLTTCA